jgi:hypothetical protein
LPADQPTPAASSSPSGTQRRTPPRPTGSCTREKPTYTRGSAPSKPASRATCHAPKARPFGGVACSGSSGASCSLQKQVSDASAEEPVNLFVFLTSRIFEVPHVPQIPGPHPRGPTLLPAPASRSRSPCTPTPWRTRRIAAQL